MAISLNEQSFEETLKELEDILERLENSQVSLDDMVKSYERAKECLRLCRKKLGDAELKIKKIDASGGMEDFGTEK